ncbi:hypothetical protein [Anaerosporobacter sp.]|uniref:hypothetical protein n=1 Tax=Anaerosporobacter sp. TaxID=1872529 RepID=UPI00286ED641|nr:hypothetical protein [Anaerosporobacter sp.]
MKLMNSKILSILKILQKTLIVSVIIYISYMILTPIKIDLLAFLGIYLYSFFIVLIYELFIFIIKKRVDK